MSQHSEVSVPGWGGDQRSDCVTSSEKPITVNEKRHVSIDAMACPQAAKLPSIIV